MLGQVTTKTPVSIRLNDELLELLEQVSEVEGSVFWRRDRTWLIEYAINQTYSDYLARANQDLDKERAPLS